MNFICTGNDKAKPYKVSEQHEVTKEEILSIIESALDIIKVIKRSRNNEQ